MEDFSQTLAFEVKKEIADRYFGFRKIIEEDSNYYQQEVITSTLLLEKRIGFDLLRIYSLLQEDHLITRFFELTKLDDVLFFDPYVSHSPTIRKRLFADQHVRGFFRKGRFRNMFFDVYTTFGDHVDSYRKKFAALIEQHEIIEEEIKLFYQKNDISGIMLFLRKLDSGDSGTSGSMSGAIESEGTIAIEQKMRLQAPQSVARVLPSLPAIPDLAAIKSELNKLINEAYASQPDFDLKNL
jgi:hypothetical protein